LNLFTVVLSGDRGKFRQRLSKEKRKKNSGSRQPAAVPGNSNRELAPLPAASCPRFAGGESRTPGAVIRQLFLATVTVNWHRCPLPAA
jgi:hypothetical protein